MNRAGPAAAFILLLAAGGAARAGESFSFSSATITCDALEYISPESMVLARGNVVMVSSGTRLEADRITVRLNGRTAEARGRVSAGDGKLLILAESAEFDGAASTAVFNNAYLEDPPYRLWARRMVRVSSEMYHMEHAAVTSCRLDPPHYHVRMASLDYAPGKGAVARWPRLALGEDTVFGVPWYRKTFGRKPWTLTVDPGHSNYHGYFTKSVFSYRLTEHGTARLYWDHRWKTGDGFGGEYTYLSPAARGSLYGYRIRDRVAKAKRWNARLAHWQALAPRLFLQANALAQSDTNFNNLYFHDDLHRVLLTSQSDAALTHAHPLVTSRLAVRRDEVFDPARKSFVGQKTVLPELAFQTSPLAVAARTYLSWGMAVRRQYDRPMASPPAPSPLFPDRDRFRGSGETTLSLRRQVPLGRRTSLEPSAGVSENWRSWSDAGTGGRDPHHFFQGRGFTGLGLRHRLTRRTDLDLSHAYRVRWSSGRFKREHGAADEGLEVNQLNAAAAYRRPSFVFRARSGYDLRDTAGETIRTPRQKVTPPSLDWAWDPARNVSLSYFQGFLLHPVRRTRFTQFHSRFGDLLGFHFSTGFSYNSASPGVLNLRHGAAFSLTRGWGMEANVRYVARGDGGLRYDALPKDRIERNLTVRRDLHCWSSRFTLRRRPGVNEFFIRIDLNAQASARRELGSPQERQYYPGRDIEEK